MLKSHAHKRQPLGTAGPLALDRDNLVGGSGEPFFVLINCDIISEYHFAELMGFHKSHGDEATIMVTKVNPCGHCSCAIIFRQANCYVSIGGRTNKICCCDYRGRNRKGGTFCRDVKNICDLQNQFRDLPV